MSDDGSRIITYLCTSSKDYIKKAEFLKTVYASGKSNITALHMDAKKHEITVHYILPSHLPDGGLMINTGWIDIITVIK